MWVDFHVRFQKEMDFIPLEEALLWIMVSILAGGNGIS